MNIQKIFDRKFLRFIIVGVINTIFGTTIMFVFYNLFHLDYWISSFSNYFFGSILSYFLNKYYTFQYQERNVRVIVKFILNILVCYLIAYGLAKPIIAYLLQSFSKSVVDNVAMALGVCIFTFLNYIGQRYFAFRDTK